MSITQIAETMLRREYNKKMITLPVKFWNLVEYKPKYQLQMRLAAKFIRAYGEEAVQTVIDREAWCYSLAAKALPDMMEAQAEVLKTEKMVQRATPKAIEVIDESIPKFRMGEVKKRNYE